jgi:hypothetical protein
VDFFDKKSEEAQFAVINAVDELLAPRNDVRPDSLLSTVATGLDLLADKAENAKAQIRKISEEVIQRQIDIEEADDESTTELPFIFSKEFLKASETLSKSLRGNIEGAIVGAFTGKGFDAAEFFSKASGDLLKFSMDKALKSLQDTFGNAFLDLAENFGVDIGENVAAGIVGAVGIGLSILAGSLKKTKSTGAFADIANQVESAEATRGIVVGPQDIAIAQVSTSIADSFVGTNILLTEANSLKREEIRLLRALAGGTAGSSLIDAGAASVELTSASLG